MILSLGIFYARVEIHVAAIFHTLQFVHDQICILIAAKEVDSPP